MVQNEYSGHTFLRTSQSLPQLRQCNEMDQGNQFHLEYVSSLLLHYLRVLVLMRSGVIAGINQFMCMVAANLGCKAHHYCLSHLHSDYVHAL